MAELNGFPADLNQVKALALTNYGHFTSMRVDGLRVRGLSLHLDRLVRDCRRLFDAELDPERVRHLIRQAVADVSGAIVVRVTVFDPDLELGHPGAEAEPRILVTTRSAPQTPLPPLRLQSTRYDREMPDVKHVGLFGSLRHRRIAQRAGFDDVVFIDARSNVSELATSNVGFFDGDRIVWPEAAWLPGVTMASIDEVHEGQIATVPVGLSELTDMQAAFATNAVVGVRAIASVDGIEWTDEHPILGILRKEYADIPTEPL
jgi:branched-subunit amino acid aminotransferase/4-amino-4-deoxychorismate lyase